METTASQVIFDFDEDGGLKALEKLEAIMCSAHWSRRRLNYEDDRTALLIHLIRLNGLAVYECRNPLEPDYSEENVCRARKLTNLFRKRQMDSSMLKLAMLFPNQEPDLRIREHNALFYPGLKVFIRCGDLDAGDLFDMLEHEGCDGVIVFPGDYATDHTVAYYTFARFMSRQELIEMLEKLREQLQQKMFEIQNLLHEKHGSPFPPIPREDSETE